MNPFFYVGKDIICSVLGARDKPKPQNAKQKPRYISYSKEPPQSHSSFNSPK